MRLQKLLSVSALVALFAACNPFASAPPAQTVRDAAKVVDQTCAALPLLPAGEERDALKAACAVYQRCSE